MAFSKEGTD